MTRVFFPVLLAIGSLAAFLSAALSMRGVSYASDAFASSMQAHIESPHTADNQLIEWTPQAEQALNDSVAAAKHAETAADVGPAIEWLREKSALEGDASKRMQLLCGTADLYSGLLERFPRDAALLLGLGSTRQLLGPTACGNTPAGSFEPAVAAALKWAPFDHNVLFGAAMVELWSGDRVSALALFKRLITYDPDVLPSEQAVILRELHSGQDLQAALPVRLAQMLHWSRLLRERRPADFDAWHAALAPLQIDSISEARARVQRKELPPDLFERDLIELLPVSAGDAVRRVIDNDLAQINAQRGDAINAQFFALRSEMQRLAIVPAALAADTRPTTTSLARWGGDEVTHIDDFNQSVGFFLAPQQGVSLIVLSSAIGNAALEPASLRLFGSDDNEHWDEIAAKNIMAPVIGGNSVVALAMPAEGRRYWKLNYNSAQHAKKFGAPLQDLLSVYGNGAPRDDEDPQ